MNNYNKVIAALGLKMNQQFKIVGYSNIYKFTDEGLMFLAPNGVWLNEFDDGAMDILMGKLEILAKKILLTEQEEQWLKNLLSIPFMQSFMTIKKLPINDYKIPYHKLDLYLVLPEFYQNFLVKSKYDFLRRRRYLRKI